MLGASVFLTGACLLLLSSAHAAEAGAQEAAREVVRVEPERSIDVRSQIELLRFEAWEKAALTRRIAGPVYLAGFHVPAVRDCGSFQGPLSRIFGVGFGASLWRDWVTGFPLG
jgi:hypothetical protein